MQKLQNKLSDWNLREIRQIETLIREYCRTPDLIMLYGEFVDGTPRSVAGGYEFLVIIANDDMVDREALQDYINEKLPPLERVVKPIRISQLSTEMFRAKACHVVYLHDIFCNGIVMHSHHPHQWKYINERRQVKQKYIQAMHEKAIRHLEYGDGLMDAADQMMIGRYWGICPHFFYYAIEQYCIAMEWKYYGFLREYDNLSRRYEMIKHASEKLFNLAEEKQNQLRRMFKQLTKYREVCLYSYDFNTSFEVLEKYEKLIKEIQEVVWEICDK